MTRIAIFHDPAFRAMPTYGAEDASAALSAAGHAVASVDAAGLARLDRRQADVLVLPYLDGTFEEAALAGLVAFHAAGGGVVVLGDLPHQGPWYPYRNTEGWRLHMTRSHGPFRIDGLSDSGKAILGWEALPHADFFEGRVISALRTTAYPPDVTHVLVVSNDRDMAWHATPVVAVERFGDSFLGARFAMVGFNGGEPRENVAGVAHLPWEYDPGLLTREWRGMDPLLVKLVAWCEPRKVAVRLDVAAVHREDEPAVPVVHVRNLTDERLSVSVRWNGGEGDRHGGDAAPETPQDGRAAAFDAWEGRWSGDLAPQGWQQLPLDLPPRPFGLHRHAVEVRLDGQAMAEHATAEHTTVEHVLPAGTSEAPGFGFSTFWAFPGGRMVPAFREFCREMQRRGCQYVRVNIPWEDVEPEPGRYDWTLPDDMLALAKECGLLLRFWMFPTTLGSGLGEAGVPPWSLREPAVAVDGRMGYFPTLWSPFYRQYYFAMVSAFAQRYAQAPELDRLVMDFGNSDFPYGYFYYGGDNTLFDYSPQENDAFRNYVRRQTRESLDAAAALLGRERLEDWSEVSVPLPAEIKAWRLYLDFRSWSVQQGIAEVESIVRREAPAKLSPDLPGHGAGSISDLRSYGLDAKRRHGHEEPAGETELCRLHNSGTSWGGEAWQVGACYAAYDDALFQSLRLNADYLTLPGLDLGLHGEDVARIGFIRRSIMGAERDRPEVAIMDRLDWNAWQSLAQVGSKLDIEVDLLQPEHRHDYSCYRLLVLPPEPWLVAGTVTGGGGGSLVPRDAAWWVRLREAVDKGLNVLLHPGMVLAEGFPLADAFRLPPVQYSERRESHVCWPDAFGGGESHGRCRAVSAEGETVVSGADGEPVLVRHAAGQGALWFAGYDTEPDSLDGSLQGERDREYAGHTLVRLAGAVGISPTSVDSACCNVWKSVVRRGDDAFLLVFSHRPNAFQETLRFRSEKAVAGALDLATGERFGVHADRPGWYRIELTVRPRQGRYLYFMSQAPRTVLPGNPL